MLRLLTCCVLSHAAAKTSPYSFSLSTFSPEGRIQQIEFAGKAVDNGPPCAAITTRDGVVLAKAYKKASEKALVVENQSLHILRVTESTIATYAGLPADFRALVDAARTIAIELEKTNGFPPSASMLATEVGRRVQERTQRGGFRPYGCSLILASPSSLYRVDPSGWVAPLRACAAGAGSASIQADLATILDSDEDGATAKRRLVGLLQADGRGVAVATVSSDEPIEIDVDASTGEAGEEAVAPAG
jgi:20S proteasome subunit alpha 2